MTTAGSERLRIGLIGHGAWARRVHIPSIAMSPSAVLAAVCGPDADRARELAAQHGASLATADASEVIGSPEVDAVLIAAPNDVHPPAAIAAATAGKAVLCEKPLAVALADAKAMTRAAERARITNMTAFTWRLVPAARLAQTMIASGEIGRVFHVSAHFLQGRGLTLDTQRLWRFDRRRAGSGILDDLGVHVFDLLTWITGERITRACAGLATFGPKPAVRGQEPVFDDAQLLVEFASGTRGTVRLSSIATAAGRPPFPEMHQGVELYGDRGAIIYDLHTHSSLEIRVPDRAAQRVAAPEPLPDSHDEWVVTRELGRRQIEQFAATVRRGRPADPDFRAGLWAQAVVDACARSWTAQRWVEVEDVDQHEAPAP
jgi:predicted dehydrogenase